jgi:hypothetical protein
MTKAPTLEAFLRRVSRQAKRVFAASGEIEPVVIVQDTAGKESLLVVSDMTRGSSPHEAAERRDRLVPWLRQYFIEHDTARYVIVVECWEGQPGPDGSVSSNPNRREVVQITVEDRDQQIMAFREIIRPAGRKPCLGKLEIPTPDPGTTYGGRFAYLLSLPPGRYILADYYDSMPNGCPHCGSDDGPTQIGRSLWGYCTQHKVRWLAGWDSAPQSEDEKQRRYGSIGAFTYVGPDQHEYEQFVRDRHFGGKP